MKLVQEAEALGARRNEAADALGLCLRTLQRWTVQPDGEDNRKGPHTKPAHALSDEEEQAILRLANSPAYRNLTPEQVVAKAAENGVYICSERTLRRLLKRTGQDGHRGRAKAPKKRHPPKEYRACGPLEVMSWDITYLRHKTIRGDFFYLYLFIDIWSRKILHWTIENEQNDEHAARAITELCREHGIQKPDINVLHSDNGGPMKGATMLATLEALGITRSFSRPSVSNDNPYSESMFRTLKYMPEYPPKGFASIDEARQWMTSFVRMYNEHHLHSSIGYVTPDSRHEGRDQAIFKARQATYTAAKKANPRRWTKDVRRWQGPKTVVLNPDSRIVEIAAPEAVAA